MNLVATFNVGSQWYAEYTIPYMRRYAARVGAEFLEFRSFEGARPYGRVPAWLRLEALRRFAERLPHDKLLLLDADVLVLPGCPDLFPQVGRRVVAVQDMGMPAASERYADWCVRLLAERPNHARYFNAGVLALSKATAIRLLPLLDGPYPDEPYFEQDYLNLRIQNRIGVDFLPVEYNWLAPQFTDSAIEQRMVHFVGEYKSMLPAFVSRVEAEAACVR